MTRHEMRQMRKAWKMREREIEELNNPKPVMYAGDILKHLVFSAVAGCVMMGTGWLLAFVIYHLMVALGMY